MKKIKFDSELNALQFSNRVNGVQNYVDGKWEVEFSNVNNATREWLNKKCNKELESFYSIKCYNRLYDPVEMYGEYSSYEIAEGDLKNIISKVDRVVEFFEIVKLLNC